MARPSATLINRAFGEFSFAGKAVCALTLTAPITKTHAAHKAILAKPVAKPCAARETFSIFASLSQLSAGRRSNLCKSGKPMESPAHSPAPKREQAPRDKGKSSLHSTKTLGFSPDNRTCVRRTCPFGQWPRVMGEPTLMYCCGRCGVFSCSGRLPQLNVRLQLVHHFLELRNVERLRAIADGLFRCGVHFHDQTVSADRHRRALANALTRPARAFTLSIWKCTSPPSKKRGSPRSRPRKASTPKSW